jgi:membrane protein DedA with SNARE-associated domain
MFSEHLSWYASIFGWLFLTGIGLPPLPEEAGILYAAGLSALHPEVQWWGAWPACGLGILCADCVLYGVGRWWGQALFEHRWVQRILSTSRRQRLEARFHRNGIGLLILARFLPPLRTGVFLISGSSHYPFPKFFLIDVIYCVVGVGVVFFGGAGLVAAAHRVGHPAVWLAVVPIVGYGLYRYFRYLKQREDGFVLAVSSVLSPAGMTPVAQADRTPTGAAITIRDAQDGIGV